MVLRSNFANSLQPWPSSTNAFIIYDPLELKRTRMGGDFSRRTAQGFGLKPRTDRKW